MMTDMCANGIVIQQKLEDGILGGLYQASFPIHYQNIVFDVKITQYGIRKTTITSHTKTKLDMLIHLFNQVDMLIMLGEGHFIPISEAEICNEDEIVNSPVLNEKLSNRLKMFNSADFTQGSLNSFIQFDKYLNTETMQNWLSISSELYILHPMVLYSLSDTGITIDCKCAFLIESFETLSELIEQRIQDFTRPSIRKGESKLGKYIRVIINRFGKDIFSEEITNEEAFVNILVNSRNKIAHIKSKQNHRYLNGSECVLYAVKLSFLYRRVLLELLHVEYSLYSSTLKKSIKEWNEWNNILTDFKKKID